MKKLYSVSRSILAIIGGGNIVTTNAELFWDAKIVK